MPVTTEKTRTLVNAAPTDPSVEPAVPLGTSLALREGFRPSRRVPARLCRRRPATARSRRRWGLSR